MADGVDDYGNVDDTEQMIYDAQGAIDQDFLSQILDGTGIDPTDLHYGGDAKFYRTDGSLSLGNITGDSDITGGGSIKNALSGASSWIKDNKELASMIGSGIVGAVKDKNAREMSQAQIDYYKQRQADLNNSVKSYTRNPNQKV
mgnify:FL=1